MRIIGGEFKRRIIRFPKTKETRPMMDRIKETIFNMLGDTVQDCQVFDLFSGSGSLGLEALSRGARHAVFVDSQSAACDIIRANLKMLGIDRNRWEIHPFPVSQTIRRMNQKNRKFDLLFLDPPFDHDYLKKVLRQLDGFDIVKSLGKIVYQRSIREPLPDQNDLSKFKLIDERKIGQAYIGLIMRTAEQEST